MCTLDGCGKGKDLPPIKVTDSERRLFLAGLASLPLATVLAYPELAKASAESTQPFVLDTAAGNKATGVIAMPAKLPAPAVVLIHEWWGLNDQIKSVAAEMAEQGYIAVALDLYNGEVGTNPEEAMALMRGMDGAVATDQLTATIKHLREHKDATGKVGTMGWCFGGGWSLNASIATPVDATVIYYGRVNKEAADLSSLSGPVLGHFGELDKSINKEMVDGFEAAMGEAGKADSLTVNWYSADHAFANPSSARYDEEDAASAWMRTQDFFQQHLGS